MQTVAPMRSLLLVAVSVVSFGCGRGLDFSEQVESHRCAESPTTAARLELAGRYEFGKQVQQGFAGTWGTLASMTLEPDGRASMMYGEGCLMSEVTGTWTSDEASGLLTVSAGQWTDADGNPLDVSALTLSRGTGGDLLASGATRQGAKLAQTWRRLP